VRKFNQGSAAAIAQYPGRKVIIRVEQLGQLIYRPAGVVLLQPGQYRAVSQWNIIFMVSPREKQFLSSNFIL
jgi:hypothetical protein